MILNLQFYLFRRIMGDGCTVHLVIVEQHNQGLFQVSTIHDIIYTIHDYSHITLTLWDKIKKYQEDLTF